MLPESSVFRPVLLLAIKSILIHLVSLYATLLTHIPNQIGEGSSSCLLLRTFSFQHNRKLVIRYRVRHALIALFLSCPCAQHLSRNVPAVAGHSLRQCCRVQGHSKRDNWDIPLEICDYVLLSRSLCFSK